MDVSARFRGRTLVVRLVHYSLCVGPGERRSRGLRGQLFADLPVHPLLECGEPLGRTDELMSRLLILHHTFLSQLMPFGSRSSKKKGSRRSLGIVEFLQFDAKRGL